MLVQLFITLQYNIKQRYTKIGHQRFIDIFTQKTIVHFSASTFILLFETFFMLFRPYLHYIWCIVLRNLVSNISTKEPKKHHNHGPICTFFKQVRCKFKAHFGWVHINYVIFFNLNQNKIISKILLLFFYFYSI